MSTSRIASLKGKNSFEQVFRQCRKLSNGSLTVHLRFRRPSEKPELGVDTAVERTAEPLLQSPAQPIVLSAPRLSEQQTRVGIMLRKKMLPSAVLRNRVKRLIREALRHISNEQPQLFDNIDAMIVSWNTRYDSGSSTLRLQDIAPLVQNVLEQAVALNTVKNRRSST